MQKLTFINLFVSQRHMAQDLVLSDFAGENLKYLPCVIAEISDPNCWLFHVFHSF